MTGRVSTRISTLTFMVSGIATAGLPFLAWFAYDTPRGRVTATGVDATPELWSLVVLGAFIALAGLALVAERGGAALALAVGAAAAICVGWAIENALNVPVGLLVVDPAGEASRVADGLVPVHVLPAAYLAAAAAALGGMAAMLHRLERVV